MFLDIDGVLAPSTWNVKTERVPGVAYDFPFFDTDCVERLARIVRETGATIVLSTEWRYFEPVKRRILARFQAFGPPLDRGV